METTSSRMTATVTIRDDATVDVTVGDRTETITETTVAAAREAAFALVAAHATLLDRPISVTCTDATGTTKLVVSKDGSVRENTRGAASAPVVIEVPAAAKPAPAPEQAPAPRGPDRANGTQRRSFIAEEAQAPRAEEGFRGAMNKLGFHFKPSSSEAAKREDVTRVSQHWAGPRTIAIVNGKGGASKTPTTAMLSAVFARHGGSGVLAWDNNETRGTLGWRTEQGQHDATVQALLPNAAALMDAQAQASDLTQFLHHQVADKYDVLRSNPNILAEDQRLTMDEFDAIHAVSAKYFRLIFIDSGNDESADRWRRMIDRADQIVIATTARGEHAEAGALLLEALRDRDERQAALAKNAVVVVSQADHKGGVAAAQHVADGFRTMARATAVIPFDRAMRAGKLTYDSLQPDTQRAWLAAAAAVAQGL